jgi:hypothetical protein
VFEKHLWWKIGGICFRPKRALKLFTRLVEAWRAGEMGFSGYIPPEVRFHPENIHYGSREHANFLFFCAFLSQHGVNTERVINELSEVVSFSDEMLAMIDPLNDHDDGRISTWLVSFGFVMWGDKKRMNWWIANWKKLKSEYDGDARKIFLDINLTRQNLLDRIREFDGFGLKVASLFIVMCQGVCWHFDPTSPISENLFSELVKIRAVAPDSHLMRLMKRGDLVKSFLRDHHHVISESTAGFVYELGTRKMFSTRELSQASFILGSKICRNKPSDPVEQSVYCRKNCPIEELCRFHVTSPEYGTKGKLGWGKATRRQISQ